MVGVHFSLEGDPWNKNLKGIGLMELYEPLHPHGLATIILAQYMDADKDNRGDSTQDPPQAPGLHLMGTATATTSVGNSTTPYHWHQG